MGFKKIKRRKNGGFTMIEMLTGSAIMIILFALGFVEVAKSKRALKVTELDNMAREIYLAAENRAVTLTRSGRLTEKSFTGTGGAGGTHLDIPEYTDTLYYVKSPGANLDDLLPVGTIDPTLRGASFYIVYDIDAGCVKDVFFDEKVSGENFDAAFSADAYALSGSSGFEAFYKYWSGTGANHSRGTRADNNIYIGYYGGEGVAPPTITESKKTPGTIVPIKVKPEIKIYNEEDLDLEVKLKDPDDKEKIISEADIIGWKLEVKITYGRKVVKLPEVTLSTGKHSPGSNAYEWTLDALGGEDRPHFKDLWWKKADGSYMTKEEKEAAGVPLSLGENFVVTARVVKDDTFVGNRAIVTAIPAIAQQANSLFDDASINKPERAIISNLRHLQNLDESFSGVLDKTEAYQTTDIDASKLMDNNGDVIQENYKFHPITNSQLKSYTSCFNEATGEYYSIKNLTVKVEATDTTIPGAGLFAKVVGDPDTFKFENVRLINASVDGGGKPTGSLVGTATNVAFEGCRVYWTDTAELEKDGKLEYKINGGGATGGLVGELYNGNITMSFAATTIQGTGDMGGLVGKAEDVKIEKAYADCYLKGESENLKAGGLIGSASGTTTLENVYSTGFIEWTNTDASAVAGFCASGSVTAKNAYSGVYYQATGDYENVLAGGKAQAFGKGEMTDCYAAWGSGSNKGYEGLKNLSLGSAFESKDNSQNSSPYRLGNNSGLGNYEAPGIVGLPHYGDWANGNQGGLPIVWVENGEELLAKIQVKGDGEGNINTPYVKLYYGDKTVDIPAGSIKKQGYTLIPSSTKSEVLWSVTLDSLNGKHFQDWWAGLDSPPSSFGGDFSVVASTDGSTWTKQSAQSSGNSLFASGAVVMKEEKPLSISGGNTAYIENLRHLQNLDYDTSKVGNKTAAVQTKDIDAGIRKNNYGKRLDKDGNPVVDGVALEPYYEFKPIANTELRRYTVQDKIDPSGVVLRGQYCEISNLKVTVTSIGTKSGAGLFAGVSSTGSDDTLVPFRFENVSLKGANITSGEAATPAGALAGTTSGTVIFNNCKTTGTTKVIGSTAGGMVGNAAGNVTFNNCKTDVTTVTDSTASGFAAGGLIGNAAGNVTFNNCKTTGNTTVKGNIAGGLIGNADGTVTFDDKCAVGSAEDGKVLASITGVTAAGGLAGKVGALSEIRNYTVASDVSATGTEGGAAGGLVGSIGTDGGALTGCTVTAGAVSATGTEGAAGGLVGSIVTGDGALTGCTVTAGTVSATGTGGTAGGLVGAAGGNVTFNSCKTSANTVTGDIAGGLIGNAAGTVTFDGKCAVGSAEDGQVLANITGVTAAGGLAGKVGALSEIRNYTVASIITATGEGGAAGGLVGSIGTGGGALTGCTVTAGAVTATGAGGTAGGLVGTAGGKLVFNNCKVVGTISDGGYNIYIVATNNAGGLVGAADGGADFNGCQVYWEINASGHTLKYQISGQNAGGLAGRMNGGNITNSFAATFVEGKSNAGGLVGSVTGTVAINNSYADCYLKGVRKGNAGGLIGSVDGTAALANVYSAGFIDCTDASKVAGLCAAGTVSAQNAYSAMYYEKLGTKIATPLVPELQAKENCYYVAYKGITYGNGGGERRTYSGMAVTDIEGFSKEPSDIHPYNLAGSSGKLTDYHLPHLNLPHYGDWRVDLPDVEISNGNTLTVRVTTVSGGYGPVVMVLYNGKLLDITGQVIQNGNVWMATLDALNGTHFNKWIGWTDGNGEAVDPPDAFGGDFEIMARYSYEKETETIWTVKKSNSLFADGTANGTAIIANLRHLQNLDSSLSGVGGITKAVQIADINAAGVPNYSFQPIVNDELGSYTGNGKTIHNLKVTATSIAGKSGAGLFAEVGTPGGTFTFDDVNLVNANVTSAGIALPVGALVGRTVAATTFTNCRVIGSRTAQNATNEPADITGSGFTGGIVGMLSAGSKVSGCTVSGIYVQSTGGTSGAGAIAGKSEGTIDTTNKVENVVPPAIVGIGP